MRAIILSFFLLVLCQRALRAQVSVDLKDFDTKTGVSVKKQDQKFTVTWPSGKGSRGELVLNLEKDKKLFEHIRLLEQGKVHEVIADTDPAFIVTIGKRDLISQNGWNIFFDKVHLKPYKAYKAELTKSSAAVRSKGSRTVIHVGRMEAGDFAGELQITLYNGSPLFNIAAVLSTAKDSTAFLYDAGLVSTNKTWQQVAWTDVYGKMQHTAVDTKDTAHHQAVKYRTIAIGGPAASIAVFPSPHQYFYPLDEAFNLRFTWYGAQYRDMLNEYGIGIRQQLNGDNRYVPWVNAPPGTRQRMDFYCLLSAKGTADAFEQVKAFTHSDVYPKLNGYKTLASHFHNEHVMTTVLAGKKNPDTPNFVKVFRSMGVDIVHLGEFHYTAHPKGPAEKRLKELKTLFEECRRLSAPDFLLLPGEEPNEFFGGHWLQFFPKPVYWIMSRKPDEPFVTEDPAYGKIYRIANSAEMLDLLKQEKGLAWTAHPRTKGSTGYPDKYKNEAFFLSDRFFGAAWKAIPADMSQPLLGKRVLDLLDDMSNWGANKKVLAEADLFTIEPENEMYAHMNINYLKLDRLPKYDGGWSGILDALNKGQFFSSTGEILIPFFTVNGSHTGDTVKLIQGAKAKISFRMKWTFPLNYAEIISGDGKQVFRERINLDSTRAFGDQTINLSLDLSGRKWVRMEVWDVAANGAFTQVMTVKE
jgi:hypothetical protein